MTVADRATWLPVLRGVGLILHVPAIMAVASLPVPLFFGESDGLRALAVTAVLGAGCGQLLYWPCRRAPAVGRHHALIIAALAWLAVAAIGAAPFALSGLPVYAAPLDAFFESLSGFTTTGISLTADPAALPHTLQWWRSVCEWVGAIGVIVVMLSVLPVDRSALSLYRSEARHLKILPSVRSTVQAIGSIYLLYSVLAVALLWLLGEPVWRALNHGLTAIATGGFTVTASPLDEAGPALKLAYAGLAIAGAISFVLHYRAIRTGRGLFSGLEVRALWLWLAVGALVLCVENAVFGVAGSRLDHAVVWVMAVTTAGFAGPDLSAWPATSLLLLTLAASGGAMAGSTCGGLKLVRMLTLGKGIVWGLQAAARTPHQVARYIFDGEVLDAEDATRRLRAAAALAAGWLALGLIGVFAMLHFVPTDTPFSALLFEVFAVQSNTGLSAGAIDPAALPAGGKLVMLALMWMGRLEIVPAMVLLALFLERR